MSAVLALALTSYFSYYLASGASSYEIENQAYLTNYEIFDWDVGIRSLLIRFFPVYHVLRHLASRMVKDHLGKYSTSRTGVTISRRFLLKNLSMSPRH